jgi:hypothetical protein
MKGRFDPEGPLWETVNGVRYALHNCAFCFGGFEEDENGYAICWVSHGFVCCSEVCAVLFKGDPNDPNASRRC